MVTSQVTEAGRGSAECLIVVTDNEIDLDTRLYYFSVVAWIVWYVVSSSVKVVEDSEGSSSKLAEVTAV